MMVIKNKKKKKTGQTTVDIYYYYENDSVDGILYSYYILWAFKSFVTV